MSKTEIPQFLVAAPTSGSGKTTVARALMALCVRQGLHVQPFKCGPDYIDTKFHEQVCGRSSVNLDMFMASEAHVRSLYGRYAADAGVCVVEGMMGMFDGYDRSLGSSAEVACLLDIPVVLVVDAKSAAYSLAALISGYIHFDSRVRVAGVIFNKVGSLRHEEMLREVCLDLNVDCFGCLRSSNALVCGGRHLGLDFSQVQPESEQLLDLIGKQLDWGLLLKNTLKLRPSFVASRKSLSSDLHITVLRNEEAFSFIYAEHLDLLRSMGEVCFINPEQDSTIPADTDLLYLPGGYPEKHAKALSEQKEMLQSIHRYIEGGGRALAECGGMMYLSQGIDTDEYGFCELAGVLPFRVTARSEKMKLTLGYRRFETGGQFLRGHEFHYSSLMPRDETLMCDTIQVYNAKGQPVPTPVYRYKKLIAGYTHLYWGEADILKLFE